MTRVLLAFVCVLATTPLSASDGPPVPLETRARGAHSVVIATVVDVNPRFGTNAFGDRLILSDVLLEVSEALKGPVTQLETVTIEGGQIGDLTLSVSDLPVMKRGERAVFFLERTARGQLIPHKRGLGILRLDVTDRVERTNLTLGEVRSAVERSRN